MTRPGRYGSERIHLTNVPCQVANGQGQLIQYWRQYLYVIDRIPVHGPARSGIVDYRLSPRRQDLTSVLLQYAK